MDIHGPLPNLAILCSSVQKISTSIIFDFHMCTSIQEYLYNIQMTMSCSHMKGC